MANFLITLFLGWAGVHKFMEGKIGMGFLYLFTFGLLGIGWLIDTIAAAANINSSASSSGQNVLPAPDTTKTSTTDATEKTKTEGHKVAGTSYHQNELESLGRKNAIYSMTKEQIISSNMVDKMIYQYIFDKMECQLIPEPENEHDPNAVKVVVQGVHIGYIKKGSCTHIKKLLDSDSIESVSAHIYGGKSKWVYKCSDGNNDYEIEHDTSEYGAKIEIKLRDNNPEQLPQFR